MGRVDAPPTFDQARDVAPAPACPFRLRSQTFTKAFSTRQNDTDAEFRACSPEHSPRAPGLGLDGASSEPGLAAQSKQRVPKSSSPTTPGGCQTDHTPAAGGIRKAEPGCKRTRTRPTFHLFRASSWRPPQSAPSAHVATLEGSCHPPKSKTPRPADRQSVARRFICTLQRYKQTEKLLRSH